MQKQTGKLAALGLMMAAALLPQGPGRAEDAPEIKTQPVRGAVSVLFGAGGNIGVSVGEDGVYIIDDQFDYMDAKIRAAVAALSDKPIRFVINTHFHGDHTGDNKAMGGSGAVIIAHDNVRQRLSAGAFVKAFNSQIDPQPGVALPVVTFFEEMALHLNGEEARIIHLANAHTDGDAMIWFRGSNVLHMGDVMFNGMFPFIDVDHGGSIDGVLAGLDRALEIADDETKVIPGHGAVTDKAGLKAYRDGLGEMRDIIAKLKEKGKSLIEVKASAPVKDYIGRYAEVRNGWANEFVGFVYDSLP